MVESFLGAQTDIDLSGSGGHYPPGGSLPGVDLVTEGAFTLSRVLDLLTRRAEGGTTSDPQDPALSITGLCTEAEAIEFFYGTAFPRAPKGVPDKKALVGKLADVLEAQGKRVTVYKY